MKDEEPYIKDRTKQVKDFMIKRFKPEVYTPGHPKYETFWIKTWLTIVLIALLVGFGLGGAYYSGKVNDAVQLELDKVAKQYAENGFNYRASLITASKLNYKPNITLELD